MAAILKQTSVRLRTTSVIEAGLPVVLVAVGLLSEDPMVWLGALVFAFAALLAVVLGGAYALDGLARRSTERIQGPRTKPPPRRREVLETTRSMFIAATLAAWPLSMWVLGHPTGLVWDLSHTPFTPLSITVVMVLGVFGMDAWLYWKHRLLHTRLLFPFHKNHHHFRDPTPLTGFAVGSVEAFLTFWPTLLLCIPQAVHWVPVYWPLVFGFIGLNLYLHSGVTYRWIEATLPKVYLNTSAFHNVHHSHVKANFGESMYLWDVICKTRLEDVKCAPPPGPVGSALK
jgi:sterol desaturase/sphingolipid hydroxylase (fatty acid hydroxylase superfamily)